VVFVRVVLAPLPSPPICAQSCEPPSPTTCRVRWCGCGHACFALQVPLSKCLVLSSPRRNTMCGAVGAAAAPAGTPPMPSSGVAPPVSKAVVAVGEGGGRPAGADGRRHERLGHLSSQASTRVKKRHARMASRDTSGSCGAQGPDVPGRWTPSLRYAGARVHVGHWGSVPLVWFGFVVAPTHAADGRVLDVVGCRVQVARVPPCHRVCSLVRSRHRWRARWCGKGWPWAVRHWCCGAPPAQGQNGRLDVIGARSCNAAICHPAGRSHGRGCKSCVGRAEATVSKTQSRWFARPTPGGCICGRRRNQWGSRGGGGGSRTKHACRGNGCQPAGTPAPCALWRWRQRRRRWWWWRWWWCLRVIRATRFRVCIRLCAASFVHPW